MLPVKEQIITYSLVKEIEKTNRVRPITTNSQAIGAKNVHTAPCGYNQQ